MTPLFIPEEGSHWYTRTGEPAYDAKPADAKRDGLLPSVTAILKLVPKSALDRWIKEQIVLAALTLPRRDGEGEDAFARRVVHDSQEEGKQSQVAGGRLHEVMECVVRDHDLPPALSDLESHYTALRAWWKQQDWRTSSVERCFANTAEGYGGRVDWTGYVYLGSERVHAVVDWKTRHTKPGQPITHWPEYCAQLAAYARGIGSEDDDVVLFSVVVSRNEPGRVDVYSWGNFTICPARAMWRAFLAARDFYYSALGPGSELPWNQAAEQKRAIEERKDQMARLFDRIEAAEPHPGVRPSARG